MKWLNCTGDVVVGDTVRFTEGVFSGGSFGRFRRSAKHVGDRTITARVIRDSYGRDKQQHTFTLLVLMSEGCAPIEPGTQMTRKGRNVYRNGTERLEWDDESARQHVADEKHDR